MKNSLFIVGCFAHNPQGILAAIGHFTLVAIKCGFNFLFKFAFELRVAAFAYAEEWRGLFHDPKLALWHDLSLAQGGDGV
jgi:hypothetical protein